jgi:hypothetical protein
VVAVFIHGPYQTSNQPATQHTRPHDAIVVRADRRS